MKPPSLEVKRQIVHALFGVFVVVLIEQGVLSRITLLSLTLVGFLLSLQCKKKPLPVLRWFLRQFEREEDSKKLPAKGLLFYLTGASLVMVLFPRDIALASIMVLALGDAVSHLFGAHFGKVLHPLSNRKFIEGSIAGFIAGAAGASLFVAPPEAFVAAFLAMLSEAVEVRLGARQIDDNVIIPIVAGFAIWVLRLVTIVLK